jgi:flagellar export protein FliJ
MRAFKFRLQAVSKLRTQVRDKAAEALGAVLESIRIVREQISHLDREIQEAKRLRHAASSGAIRVDRLLTVQRHQFMLESQRDQIQAHLELLQQEEERRRYTLLEAEKELRVLEKLEEKQYKQWEMDQLAADQKQIDEWAALRGKQNQDQR